jgi:choline kinase
MKAIILAAGVGSRLLPHTHELPKCLLEIKGKPIIQHQLEALRLNHLKEVVVVIGHQGNKLKDFLSQEEFSDFNFKFIENKNYKDTNSSYSLWLAKDLIKEGFIYLNSDLIFHPDLLRRLLENKSPSSIIINKDIKTNDDMFKINLEGDKITLIDKNLPLHEAHGKAIGPAKFDSNHSLKLIEKLDELILKGNKNEWVYSIFSKFAQENPFLAIENEGLYWGEIDIPDDLENIKSLLKN